MWLRDRIPRAGVPVCGPPRRCVPSIPNFRISEFSLNWLGKRTTFEWIGVEFNNMRSERRLANPSQSCEYSNLNGCGMWYVVGCGARRVSRTYCGKSLGPLGYKLHTGPTLVMMHTVRLDHADAGIHANTSVPRTQQPPATALLDPRLTPA